MSRGRLGLEHWLRHIEGVHFRSIDLTLDRVRRVAHVLGLPAENCHVVVAGTNGKGSSVSYLESIYREAGYRTGAYTSPHLVHYRERVRLNGMPVPDATLVDAFAAVDEARRNIPLTYFEFGTLAALLAFRQLAPDIVILEVGMGGRLDAVNIVDADVALITEIGFDHQQWLGETLDRIAAEKAGIMRYGGSAVTSAASPPSTLVEIAARKRCDLWRLGTDFVAEISASGWDWTWKGPGAVDAVRGLEVPPQGRHQVNNAAGAVAVARRLADRLPVSDARIASGVRRARLPGRLQRVAGEPPILFDVSHNVDGVSVLGRYLARHPVPGVRLAVFSMLADKDIAGSLVHVAGLFDQWFVAPLGNPRAADVRTLCGSIARVSRSPVHVARDIATAVDQARAAARPGDEVVAFGSFYAVGDIMRHLGLDPYRDPA